MLSDPGRHHFERLARLLTLESRAQAQEATERGRRLSPADAERTGTSLVDLIITDGDTGLGGRYIVQLAKRRRSPLPWTRLGVGSPVTLSPDTGQGTTGYRGVICERAESYLRVALGSMSDDLAEHETWRLDLSTDEVAVQRQRAALQRAREARAERLAELRDVLLGQQPPEFDRERDEPALNRGLNDTQQEAVRFALAARDVALIHGPPGTGKTTTVVELIRQAIRRGEKVLACAPSNLAVDNLFERLLAAGERTVRLGHPARVMADLRAHTLDLLVENHPDVRLARKLVKEAMGLFRQASRHTRAKPLPGARQETRQEAKSLLADARRLEAQAVEHILDTADVLCATTTALDKELLGTRRGGGRHRHHRPVCGPGAAPSRTVVRAGSGDRQRGRLPGPGEGGRRDFARAIQRAGRDRLSARRAANERGHDPCPPKAAGRGRQRDAFGPSVLPADDRVLRRPGGLPDRVGRGRRGLISLFSLSRGPRPHRPFANTPHRPSRRWLRSGA